MKAYAQIIDNQIRDICGTDGDAPFENAIEAPLDILTRPECYTYENGEFVYSQQALNIVNSPSIEDRVTAAEAAIASLMGV